MLAKARLLKPKFGFQEILFDDKVTLDWYSPSKPLSAAQENQSFSHQLDAILRQAILEDMSLDDDDDEVDLPAFMKTLEDNELKKIIERLLNDDESNTRTVNVSPHVIVNRLRKMTPHHTQALRNSNSLIERRTDWRFSSLWYPMTPQTMQNNVKSWNNRISSAKLALPSFGRYAICTCRRPIHDPGIHPHHSLYWTIIAHFFTPRKRAVCEFWFE
ncbi:MAG: hypothetical protein P8144_02035 [Gammaproteobacteria bacterium]